MHEPDGGRQELKQAAAGPCTERRYQGIGERTGAFLQHDHGGENFLLALNNQKIGRKDELDGGGDVVIGKPVAERSRRRRTPRPPGAP